MWYVRYACNGSGEEALKLPLKESGRRQGRREGGEKGEERRQRERERRREKDRERLCLSRRKLEKNCF